MKKTLLYALIFALLGTGLVPLAAVQAATPTINVYVKGTKLSFPSGASPYVKSGKVMIPASFVFGKMGAKVSLSKDSNKRAVVKGVLSGKTVQLTQGSSSMRVNGASKSVGSAVESVRGTVFVSVTVVQSGFGKTLKVTSPKSGANYYTIRIMQPTSTGVNTPEQAKRAVESLSKTFTAHHAAEEDLSLSSTGKYYFYISATASSGLGGDYFVEKGSGKIFMVTYDSNGNAIPDFLYQVK